MNRQQRRRICRDYGLTEAELMSLVQELKSEFEASSIETASQFLALTIEVLRLEFGFGQKRIDKYTKRLDSMLECVNMDYVSFHDLLAEISLTPLDVVRLGEGVRKEKMKELEERRDAS